MKIIGYIVEDFEKYTKVKEIKNNFTVAKKYRYKGRKIVPYDVFKIAYQIEETKEIYMWECSIFLQELLEFFEVDYVLQVKQQKIKNYCKRVGITYENFTVVNEGKFSERKVKLDRFYGLIGFIIFQQFSPTSEYPANNDFEALGYQIFYLITDALMKEFGGEYRTGTLRQQRRFKNQKQEKIDFIDFAEIPEMFKKFLEQNKPKFHTEYFVESANAQLNIFKIQEDLISREEATFLWAVDDVLSKLLKLSNPQSLKTKLKSLKSKCDYTYTPHELKREYYSEIILANKFYELMATLALHLTNTVLLDARVKRKFDKSQLETMGKECFKVFLDYVKTT